MVRRLDFQKDWHLEILMEILMCLVIAKDWRLDFLMVRRLEILKY